MMKRNMALALVALMLTVGMSVYAEEGKAEAEKTNVVALDQLPAAVKEAVLKEVEGIELMKAKTEKTDAGTVYIIIGHVKEVKWSVKVTVDGEGKVTSVKASKVEKKPEGEVKPEAEKKPEAEAEKKE